MTEDRFEFSFDEIEDKVHLVFDAYEKLKDGYLRWFSSVSIFCIF